MLWMEGPLSYLEVLCIRSFIDAGHEVVLFHYGPLSNVPNGVQLEDAARIMARGENDLVHKRTGSFALQSEAFRYRMLASEGDMIWADTDAYCLRPFESKTGYFLGWETMRYISAGVLSLPQGSETLEALLSLTSDPYPIPTFYGPDYEQELIAARESGTPLHVTKQPLGVWGPHALTHFLQQTGEDIYALPCEALYPFSFGDRRQMLRRGFNADDLITNDTCSIHLFGRRLRKRLLQEPNALPHHKSLIGELLRKHCIDPKNAPLQASENMTA